MPRRNLFWLLGVAALATFGLAVSYSAPTREKDKDYEMVRLLVDVLHKVRHDYVVDMTPERERKLVEDMINGGLERLDPHSAYINPRDYKALQARNEGKFGGIGIQVGPDRHKGGQLSVISPMPGTPAYEAGVLAGDVILKIDGKATDQMRMREAVDLIKGDPDTEVTLTLGRDGQKKPFDVTIKRAIIKVATVMGDRRQDNKSRDWDYLIDKKDGIAYIRLTDFADKSAEELKAVLKQLEDDGVRGIILDLRNNPGGLLRVAVEVSDLFLTEGVIVSTKGRNYKDEVYRAKLDGTLLQGKGQPVPVVVLINKYSASASEIVAAALQDHKRAVIIGERSYGKGSVQNLLPLEKGQSALKLTTAGYWRPSGKNIHRYDDEKDFKAAKIDPDEWGVQPDKGFEVKLTDEERLQYLIYRNERDVVRDKGKPAEKKDKDGKAKPPFEDKVLNKALEYLRGQVAKAPAPKSDA